LTQKSIMAQMYVDSNDIKISPKIDTDFWYYAEQLRAKIIGNLRKTDFLMMN